MLISLTALLSSLLIAIAAPIEVPLDAPMFTNPVRGLVYTPPPVNIPNVKGKSAIQSQSYKDLTNRLPQVLRNAVSVSTHSWEIGALTESLLEIYHPKLTPFAWDTNGLTKNDIPWAVLEIIAAAVTDYDWADSPQGNGDTALYLNPSTAPHALIPQPIIDGDGALGDPAALGMVVWLMTYFSSGSEVRDKLGDKTGSPEGWAWAAGNQLEHLRRGPKNDDGTISQRENWFQLWSDMGMMIPPFPAYLGLSTHNPDLLCFAIKQWLLESSHLLDGGSQIWHHQTDGDSGLWGTGNGWMLYGAMRVLMSIESAGQTSQLWDEVNQVRNQLASTFGSLFAQLNGDNLIPDYMLTDDSVNKRSETAGTALITAAYYRFVKYAPELTNDWMSSQAGNAFDGVVGKLDGGDWLTSVVDPLGTNGFIVPDYPVKSPEGQSFVGIMWAARTAAGF